ncbi:cation efflux protein, CzcI-like [Acinetobacter sp. 10FS3-1]|uniref:cation efflux protein, CzcI-like n=1 Tax=Acinetobacter sp. 10FS3-1 TaxID=2563897 RepID=UPI001C2E5C24|nr:cation efflux protein, CzcI-like [Acinetobacter sp. 10FS3-1]
MRLATWITVLVGLFMFQSLWNVAAAFCAHEEQASLQRYHFGHHQNTLCTSDNRQPSYHSQLDHLKQIGNDFELGEDHQDHLPSMTHLLVQDAKVMIVLPVFETQVIPEFYWKNSYQAPDLFQQSPPPEFSPLKVG